jgi:hypothetical protein
VKSFEGPLLGAALLAVFSAASCRPAGSDDILPAAPSSIAGVRTERPSPKIHDLFPPDAYVGVPFAVRFDGLSVLGVAGEGFSPDAAVYFGEEPLMTQFVTSEALAATVPAELLLRPGPASISVRDGAGNRSAAAEFRILPPRPAGECPVIHHLYPSSTEAGRGFSLRADGASSLGVAGANFGPRSVISLSGHEAATVYQGPGSLIAIVPPEELAKTTRISVVVTEAGCPPSRSPEDLTVR